MILEKLDDSVHTVDLFITMSIMIERLNKRILIDFCQLNRRGCQN